MSHGIDTPDTTRTHPIHTETSESHDARLRPLHMDHALIDAACATACRMIAPAWPLDRAIAVNPHWSRIHLPVREVAARMAVLAGIPVFPARSEQLKAWQSGRIQTIDLQQALVDCADPQASALTPGECVKRLFEPAEIKRLPLLIDLLDRDPNRTQRLSWRQAITHQVSQTCAAFFDRQQADWQPERRQDLYAFWRDTLRHDHGIGLLMGLPDLDKAVQALPATAAEAEQWVLSRLGLPETSWADYLEAVLLTVNGWASWCAYLRWQAEQQGQSDQHLRELLAIRLAWGVILLECVDPLRSAQAFRDLQYAWAEADARLQAARRELLIDEIWQLALERGYQRELRQGLGPGINAEARRKPPAVQAAFCIDVRSEPFRRALETAWPAVETLGFAGFFGLPIAYTPIATAASRPQLPGLLTPSLLVTEQVDPTASSDIRRSIVAARQTRLGDSDRAHRLARWPSAAFAFVEAAGIGYVGKLASWLLPRRSPRQRQDLHGLSPAVQSFCRPMVQGLDTAGKADLAAKVLWAMGLNQRFAPLVLLVGHGSQTCNNAHSASLDCGACCGQTGEVNSRALALLLNEPLVRAALRERAIEIPESTWFVAALHNTTTDEIEGFDLDLLPPPSRERWSLLQQALQQAGDRVRRERAPRLQLHPGRSYEGLLKCFQQRANDGAETRPEWGLAGNAAFLMAPRQRSLGSDLAGRVFLHDYDADQDADGSRLELLMTAPMLVTHWINWQYHASTCAPDHFGSGNKILHNVVGGTLGVFEGNGGDLRIGLAKQSLHDGQRWVHEPLRLTAIIEAPQARIARILQKHVLLRQLIDNGWLHLWQIDGRHVHQYGRGEWALIPEDPPATLTRSD